MLKSEVTINYVNDESHITINSGDFKDIVFKFGRVWFPNPEENKMAFEYNIIGDQPSWSEIRTNMFRTEIGDLLYELIQEQLKNEELVYTGGT